MSVTLQDLEFVVRLIDTMSTRGAIRGDELSNVGKLREKLIGVLQEETSKQKDPEPLDVSAGDAMDAVADTVYPYSSA
jgi:hypothetical protein